MGTPLYAVVSDGADLPPGSTVIYLVLHDEEGNRIVGSSLSDIGNLEQRVSILENANPPEV